MYNKQRMTHFYSMVEVSRGTFIGHFYVGKNTYRYFCWLLFCGFLKQMVCKLWNLTIYIYSFDHKP